LSPLNIKSGKKPSRLKPVNAYPARDPRLEDTSTHPFPLSSALQPTASEEGSSLPMLAKSTETPTCLGEGFKPLELEKLAASLEAQHAPESESMRVAYPDSSGGSLHSPTSNGDIVPPPLPRSYGRVWEKGYPVAAEKPGMVDMLRPMLEPSLLTTETASWVLPEALRDHQMEAVNALMGNDIFLLADDPGTGKSVAACVALASKIQSGMVRRALYVTSVSRLRAAAQTLRQWAPGLLITAVRESSDQRALDWEIPAHVYLVDYATLKTDIEREVLPRQLWDFDLILIDDVQTTGLRFQDFPGIMQRLGSSIRWAIASALPREAEDWVSLFTFLTPDQVSGTAGITLPDLRKRFRPYLMRRTKAELSKVLPARTRQELWLQLDAAHHKIYEEALAEARFTVSQLGDSLTPTHIDATLNRIKQAINFERAKLDGAKIRALVDLMEQISASDSKAVVFTHFREHGLDRLQPVLEPYGVLRLDKETPEEKRLKILDAFRSQPHWHALLIEVGTRTGDEPLVEASYIIHVDHSWNPGVRLRAELRLHPLIFRAVAIHVYELWVADTIEEKIYQLLLERGLLPAEIPEDTSPVDIEEKITKEEWLHRIFEIPVGEAPRRVPTAQPTGSGVLPGTSALREKLSELSPDTLMAAVETFIKALGYPEVEALDDPDEEGGYLLAWRQAEGVVERILIRCIRSSENIGVSKGRALLKAMETRRDCVGAYLVTTSDFTATLKTLADESGGDLALVSGAELYRHLHILGQF
jgi:superfamily II DNA or RNA helicase